MHRNSRKGLTLVEMVVAAALLSLAVVLSLRVSLDSLLLVESQLRQTEMDRITTKTLREMSRLLKAAILPYKPEYLAESGSGSVPTASDVLHDINHEVYGFGYPGNRWEARLRDGMDAIAFVLPVDAQGAEDLIDSNGHLQIGVERSGTNYVAASATGTPNSSNPDLGFKVRASTELVSVLAAMDPDRLTGAAFEAIAYPTNADWEDFTRISGKAWPEVTCFISVRFVPVLNAANAPVVLYESAALNSIGNFDMDGDGATDAAFQIGRLQLVYSGGPSFYCVRGGAVVNESVEPWIRDLTPNIILRRDDPAERTPIFRLEALRPGGSASPGGQALAISILTVSEGDVDIEAGNWRRGLRAKMLSARKAETTVLLRNMALR